MYVVCQQKNPKTRMIFAISGAQHTVSRYMLGCNLADVISIVCCLHTLIFPFLFHRAVHIAFSKTINMMRSTLLHEFTFFSILFKHEIRLHCFTTSMKKTEHKLLTLQFPYNPVNLGTELSV